MIRALRGAGRHVVDAGVPKVRGKATAGQVRSRPVYVCFEEPTDPLMFPLMFPLEDSGGEGYGGRPPGLWEPWCAQDHPGLGCGWFALARVTVDSGRGGVYVWGRSGEEL